MAIHEWTPSEQITAQKLNNLETSIEGSSNSFAAEILSLIPIENSNDFRLKYTWSELNSFIIQGRRFIIYDANKILISSWNTYLPVVGAVKYYDNQSGVTDWRVFLNCSEGELYLSAGSEQEYPKWTSSDGATE